MKSISNIKRIYNNEIYISVTIKKAIELQNRGIKLVCFNDTKSIFAKETDLICEV